MISAYAKGDPNSNRLVRAEKLVKHYRISAGPFSGKKLAVRAVDGVDLDIYSGETVGLVGESGCGKSTLGRLMLRLEEPTSGTVFFDDRDIFGLNGKAMRALRGEMQIIFQDPYSSLNPRKTIGWLIGEPLKVHGVGNKREIREKVLAIMNEVGLQSSWFHRYPHEFSGGQRQRIGIARALALNPRFIVADEPVSALDVSIQGQIINLLSDLQERYHLTYLIISHDLSVIYHMSDRIVVMYLGIVMDSGPKEDFLRPPQHPYTEALLASAPRLDPNRGGSLRAPLKGEIPSPVHPPAGCRFHTRCPYAQDVCRSVVPELLEKWPGHYMACHFR